MGIGKMTCRHQGRRFTPVGPVNLNNPDANLSSHAASLCNALVYKYLQRNDPHRSVLKKTFDAALYVTGG